MKDRIAALLNSILVNENGYIVFESLGWHFAIAPADSDGIFLVKARKESWRSYKNCATLVTGNPHSPEEWGLNFPDWTDIFPGAPREECASAFRAVLTGEEYPGEAPGPRGKPPRLGRVSGARKKSTGGGRRKASAEMEGIAAELAAMRREMEALRASEAAARENLRRVLAGEKLEMGMTPSTGPAPTAGDGSITLRNRAASLLRSAISHCERGEDAPALAALAALNRVRRGAV